MLISTIMAIILAGVSTISSGGSSSSSDLNSASETASQSIEKAAPTAPFCSKVREIPAMGCLDDRTLVKIPQKDTL